MHSGINAFAVMEENDVEDAEEIVDQLEHDIEDVEKEFEDAKKDDADPETLEKQEKAEKLIQQIEGQLDYLKQHMDTEENS